jgi:hypothetical protein
VAGDDGDAGAVAGACAVGGVRGAEKGKLSPWGRFGSQTTNLVFSVTHKGSTRRSPSVEFLTAKQLQASEFAASYSVTSPPSHTPRLAPRPALLPHKPSLVSPSTLQASELEDSSSVPSSPSRAPDVSRVTVHAPPTRPYRRS